LGGKFLSFIKKQLNSEVTVILLGRKKYTFIEGLLHLFLFLNNANTKLPLGFEKKKRLHVGVFSSF
jgi:small nuclear ribonucleoprotein (snRNP)-like protein